MTDLMLLQDLDEIIADAADEAGLESPTFAWEPTTYALKYRDMEAAAFAPAASSNALGLSVAMERKPTASGKPPVWLWHKNCTLPRLTVTLAGGGLPPDAAVLLSAVTLDVLEHAAVDQGLEGDALRPLVRGSATFSSLTFRTTSYNLKGKPLHLMATLLVPDDESPTGGGGSGGGRHHRAVCAVVSPPIRVDARKRQPKERSPSAGFGAARPAANGAHGGGGSGAALTPFAPHLLERKLEKVDRNQRQHIDNSMEGLRAYLSALNIRNK